MKKKNVMVAQKEFATGWPIVIAAAVGIGLGMSPLPFYTIGVFIGPISQEFGWEASTVLSALSVYTVVVFFIAPFVGMITDRIGARQVVLGSTILFGLAMMAQSLHNGSLYLYLFLWSLIAVFGAGTLPITFTKVVNNWFDQHRGKALGVALVSTGIFGALAKFFAAQLTLLYGWRIAYLGLGLLPILISFPISLLAFRDIDDLAAQRSVTMTQKLSALTLAFTGMAILAYYVLTFIIPQVTQQGWKLQYIVGVIFVIAVFLPLVALFFGRLNKTPSRSQPSSTGKTTNVTGATLPEALKDWRFWLLAASFVVISLCISAVIPNFEQILTSKGFAISEAVGLAILTGLAVLSGRIIGGVLIDYFWAPAVAFVFLASPAIALYLLAQPVVSSGIATLAILMIGFGAGIEYDFLAYLVAKYFGMRSYSSIYGALYSFFGLGAGFGPLILSRWAESEGEWSIALVYSAVALVLASLPLLTLGSYPVLTAAPQTAKARE